MLELLYNAPPFVAFIVVVIVTSLVAAGGLLVVRRFHPHTRAEPNNEVAGFIFAVVGVIYAVMLGFVLIVLWEQSTAMEDTIEREARSLGAMYRDTQAIGGPEAADVRRRIRAYTELVLHDEWTKMAEGVPSEKTAEGYHALRLALQTIKPSTAAEVNWHASLIDQFNAIGDSRRLRILHARYAAPPLLWLLLIVGGMITIGYSYLYGVEDLFAHSIMTCALASLITLTLFVTFELEYPFHGSEQVGAEPFERELAGFSDEDRAATVTSVPGR